MLWMCGMCTAACMVKSVHGLLLLLVVHVAGYFLARLGVSELWRDIRFFLIQMVIVTGLYMLRDGIPDGIWPGIRTSLQVLLFFLPGALFLRTTPSSRIMSSLRRFMPRRLAFFVFISFRFLPYFAGEFHDISMIQQLRGVRLTPRYWIDPRNWRDIFHCMVIPLMVRAIKTADQAAMSAVARGFGKRYGKDTDSGEAE